MTSKYKISVITPTIRPDFLSITQDCLEKQTCQDFEWHVVVGLRNRGFTLPSDWNKLIAQCNADVIVMLQDCIKIPDNFLEHILTLDVNKTCYTFPVGKIRNWEDSPNYDWRKYKNMEKIESHQWEIDLAVAPKQFFYDVGGFDERYNKGWSWENVEIACRGVYAGYGFMCDNTVDGIALDHDAIQENPFRGKRENNNKRAQKTRNDAALGNWKLDYLTTLSS